MDASLFGAMAALLSVMALLPYGRAVIRGHARPQRSSWFIWTVLSVTAFSAVVAYGGTQVLLFTGAQAGGTAAIFAMSLWRGAGSIWNPSDATVLVASGLGVVLWWVTDTPAYALGLSISIGAMAGVLTIVKTFRWPGSEAFGPWAMHLVASAFGLASVLGASALEWVYPLYLFLLCAAILGAGVAGRLRGVRARSA